MELGVVTISTRRAEAAIAERASLLQSHWWTSIRSVVPTSTWFGLKIATRHHECLGVADLRTFWWRVYSVQMDFTVVHLIHDCSRCHVCRWVVAHCWQQFWNLQQLLYSNVRVPSMTQSTILAKLDENFKFKMIPALQLRGLACYGFDCPHSRVALLDCGLVRDSAWLASSCSDAYWFLGQDHWTLCRIYYPSPSMNVPWENIRHRWACSVVLSSRMIKHIPLHFHRWDTWRSSYPCWPRQRCRQLPTLPANDWRPGSMTSIALPVVFGSSCTDRYVHWRWLPLVLPRKCRIITLLRLNEARLCRRPFRTRVGSQGW